MDNKENNDLVVELKYSGEILVLRTIQDYDPILAGLLYDHSKNQKRAAAVKKYTGSDTFPMEVEDRMRIIANLIIDRILEDKRLGKLKTKKMLESN